MSVRLIVLSLHFLYPLLANNARYFSTILLCFRPRCVKLRLPYLGLNFKRSWKYISLLNNSASKKKNQIVKNKSHLWLVFPFPTCSFSLFSTLSDATLRTSTHTVFLMVCGDKRMTPWVGTRREKSRSCIWFCIDFRRLNMTPQDSSRRTVTPCHQVLWICWGKVTILWLPRSSLVSAC